MNKLYEVLETSPNETRDQFDRSFRKVFGIPADVEGYDGGVFFNTYGERFSIDWEGTILWYLNNEWVEVRDLDEARGLWKNKKK